jgi:hypothetical protein
MRDRFVICRNPDEAARDAAIRGQILEQLRAAIAGSDDRSPAEREELACRLRGKPTYRRFLRTTAGGLLRIDRAAVTADARLDGKFLLRTSDPTLSAADVATGYKQLLEVERAWRDMKTTLDLRPVYHRREDRIRAHVLLCWLALLLIRIAETATGETWRSLAWELDKLRELGGCRRIRRLGHDFSDGITDRRRSRLAVQRQARAELVDSRRKKRLIRRRIWQSDDGHPMGE